MNDLAAPNVNDASHMNDFADAKSFIIGRADSFIAVRRIHYYNALISFRSSAITSPAFPSRK